MGFSLKSSIDSQPKTAIAYFYFDFNGDVTSMLKSLISQLSAQSEELPTPLKDLYVTHTKKTSSLPTDEVLLQAFHDILLSFHNVYIIFDALDEASRNDELLSFITTVQGWRYQRLHLLVTSRQLSEIEDMLSGLVTGKICLQNSEIRHDIAYYVTDILANDKIMSRWPEKLRWEIQTKLVYEGEGIAMTTLPKSLDKTYERILEQIDESYHTDVRKILQALTVAKKSLTVDELVEILAVNFDCGQELPQFDEDSRLLDPRAVLTMCSSLVTRLEDRDESWREMEREDDGEELKIRWQEGYKRGKWAPVRLAHASVADYLTQPKQSQFFFTRHVARQFMAQACLAYLLNSEFSSGHDQLLLMQRCQDYPLLHHLTLNWPLYVRREEGDPEDYLLPCTKKLLQAFFASHKLPGGGNYAFWLGMMMPSAPAKASFLTETHPLYYAASFGLADVVRIMLDSDKDIDIDQLGGRAHATALHVACFRNHPEVVKILLERGADPNLPNNLGESPLDYATWHDSDSETVALLLKHGADPLDVHPLADTCKTYILF
ncbi:ankyrin repeat protein [Rutstroemia sp. NJR-2017a BBW]|nr:ankyrin repeat protein [Rutstroemia sp. NJR-2017a BBW]